MCFNDGDPTFVTDPQVTVKVQRTDLPTFFSRIWGRSNLAVSATAIAEAYNPSGASALGVGNPSPVAPRCVKPWLLPNLASLGKTIFDNGTGAIQPAGAALLGTPRTLTNDCTPNCGPPLPTVTPWQYYPGDAANFPPPNAASVVCSGCGGFGPYELSIAGCVQTPISCNSTVKVDLTLDATRDTDTSTAVNGMTHSTAGNGDSVDTAAVPSPPFQFLAGADNPVVQSSSVKAGSVIMVSDSLVTVPVIDDTVLAVGYPNAKIIGFLQLFLNPTGTASPAAGPIQAQVINLVGCGTGATGTKILGNGSSPVAVRLVSP